MDMTDLPIHDPRAQSSPPSTGASTMPMKDTEPLIGHMMPRDDPDNPFNWPLHRRVHVTAVSFAFAFTVAFGATVYTAGITEVVERFDVSMTVAILGLSLYLLGIAFAPIITPHLSEAFGRATIYLFSLPLFSLFILGAAFSQNFASVAVCRFFAGFFGGPCLVLIEGTFADVWTGEVTLSYYSVLALASFVGTGAGPLVGGFVFAAKGWRWTQYITLMLALVVYFFGLGMPETYPRAIMARRARRRGQTVRLAKARSGVTLGEMFHATFLSPLKMLVSEPIVSAISLYLGFNFAVVFSFFISIPVVLHKTYNFDIQHVGLAFTAAIAGALLAATSSILIDRVVLARRRDVCPMETMAIEYRLYPAMLGGVFIMASLFWIAWTASPKVHYLTPIIGTLFYVWGNMSVLIAFISYLFDAYPSRGTLSALTAAASFRLVLGAALPLVIIQMIMGLTGAWALSVFGFISIAMLPVPFALYFWGPYLRARSRYGAERTSGAVAGEAHAEVMQTKMAEP